MFLEQIEIVNFRGIQHLSLKLDKTTVLIGEIILANQRYWTHFKRV